MCVFMWGGVVKGREDFADSARLSSDWKISSKDLFGLRRDGEEREKRNCKVWGVCQGRRKRREGNSKFKDGRDRGSSSVKSQESLKVRGSFELSVFFIKFLQLITDLFGDESPRLNFDNYQDPPFFLMSQSWLASFPPDGDCALLSF